jgi:hypothetical protein
MANTQQLLEAWRQTGVPWEQIAPAVLNPAPFTGDLTSLWSDAIAFQRQQRVAAAIAQLQERFTAAGGQFDPSRVGEAEFELLADAMVRVSREHRPQKRAAFVRLVESYWRNTEESFERRSQFTKALEDFQDVHVLIMTNLRRYGHTDSETALPFKQLCQLVVGAMTAEQQNALLFPALTLLGPTGYGFVGRRAVRTQGTGVARVFSPDWSIISAGYWINPSGVQFIRFLQPVE